MAAKTKTFEIHIPSVIGYEKVAMESAGAVASLMGFHRKRIDDLKTAVSEACTNAMEHGNRLKKDTRVLVTLKMSGESLEVNVEDQGKGPGKRTKKPKLDKQIEQCQDPRGWGIFLIQNLVDEMEFKNTPKGGNVTRMVIHMNR